MGAGRPTLFTQEIANRICTEISTTSKSLKTICLDDDMPSAMTVINWKNTNPEFLAQYARAKEEQADMMAEEILDISDDGSNDFMTITKGNESYEVENKEWTSRSKLRVESRKWLAAKLKPKRYGDKLDLTTDGDKLPGAQILTLPTDKLRQIEQLLSHNDTAADNEENTVGNTEGAI